MNQAIEEIKLNFKFVYNTTSDKHVKSLVKYEYKHEKVQSPITHKVVNDLETFNKYRAVPYAMCIYKLSKISVEYYRDITDREYEKCRINCIVFRGTDNINEMLDHVLSFKGEAKRVNNKIVENNLYLIAHNGSGFDSYIVLKNLPQWRTVVNLIKNGAGNVSRRKFNGYVDQNKKNPQYVHFRCRRVYTNSSLKKLGISY